MLKELLSLSESELALTLFLLTNFFITMRRRLSGCTADTDTGAGLRDLKIYLNYRLGHQVVKRFCNMFSESSPCLLGQNGCCITGHRPWALKCHYSTDNYAKTSPKRILSVYQVVDRFET